MHPGARLAALLLLALAPVVGAVAAWKPILVLPILAVGVVVVFPPIARRITGTRAASIAIGGIVASHVVSTLRYTWFDIEFLPIFKLLRAPLAVGLLGLLAVTGGRRLLEPRMRVPVVTLLVYLVWILLTGLWSDNPSATSFYGIWLALIALDTIAAIAVTGDPERFWRGWLVGLIWTGTAISALSLLLSFGGLELARSDRWVGDVMRVGYCGIFNNPNIMGGVAIFTLGALLARSILDGDQRRGIGWYLVAGIAIITVFGSLSRGCLAAIVMAFASFVAIQWRIGDRVFRLMLPITVSGLLLVVGLAATPLGRTTLDRALSTSNSVEEGNETRVHIWRSYFRSLRSHPVTGIGFMRTAGSQDVAAIRRGLSKTTSHSVILGYMLATGIPGTLMFSFLVFLAVRGVLPLDEGYRLRGSVLQLSLTMVPHYVLMSIAQPGNWGPFVLWVPLLFAATLSAWQPGTAPEPDHPSPRRTVAVAT